MTVVVIPTVVTVKLAELDPAGIDTEPGTEAAALSEARVTVTPPVGAAPDKVTVPAEDAPPNKVEGVSVRLCGTGGSMLSSCEKLAPKALAVSVAETRLATGCAVTAKVPVVCPDGTETVAGTVTPGVRFDVQATEKPLGGAA